VVKKINDAAAAGAYDITASLDSTGKLVISSNTYFTASSSIAAAAGGTSTSIIPRERYRIMLKPM